jgi:hypothetical protein
MQPCVLPIAGSLPYEGPDSRRRKRYPQDDQHDRSPPQRSKRVEGRLVWLLRIVENGDRFAHRIRRRTGPRARYEIDLTAVRGLEADMRIVGPRRALVAAATARPIDILDHDARHRDSSLKEKARMPDCEVAADQQPQAETSSKTFPNSASPLANVMLKVPLSSPVVRSATL